MNTAEVLTTEEAARHLHMRADSLARKLRLREIPGVKIGKRWLITKATLEALLQPKPEPEPEPELEPAGK
jgi:excisionase family DNA binding protein